MSKKLITQTTEIMKAFKAGEVLSGIRSIELLDVGDETDASMIEMATDTLADTFALTQDDSEVTEIKNEKNQNLKEVENKAPYKAALTLARWRDSHLDLFNVKRVTRGTGANKEVGVGFINIPISISKKMRLRFVGTNVYAELPEVTIRSKSNGESLRNGTYNALLNFTAKEDEHDIPLYMWERSGADVESKQVSIFADTTATLGGVLYGEAGMIITERGFVYAEHSNPVMADDKVKASGTSIGEFSAELTSLDASTMYYVRAYCIVEGETIYGNNVSFTTTATV